jgi:hypothetical protein
MYQCTLVQLHPVWPQFDDLSLVKAGEKSQLLLPVAPDAACQARHVCIDQCCVLDEHV